MKKYNWAAIKAEYVTTDISYEQLAKKYGVSKGAVYKHAKPENWIEAREEYIAKKNDEVIRRVGDSDIKNTISRIERINALSDKLIRKLERACEELGEDFIDETATTEIACYSLSKEGVRTPDGCAKITEIKRSERRKLPINRYGLRQLTAALKDLRDIQGVGAEEREEKTGVVMLAPVEEA